MHKAALPESPEFLVGEKWARRLERSQGKLPHSMENWKMTCYIPCHGSNLFKIKSICSFHTLCPTSLLQSTVDYSITLKTGCSDNKLITYFVVNCVKIFWNITNTFPLSLSLSRSFSLLMVNLVRHIDRENFLNFYHKTYCLQALKWRDWGKRFSVTPPGPPPTPHLNLQTTHLPPLCHTLQKTSWLNWFRLWSPNLNFKWSLLLFRKELSSMQ